MATLEQNRRIESEGGGGRKRKNRWDEMPHIPEDLLKPIGLLDIWPIPLDWSVMPPHFLPWHEDILKAMVDGHERNAWLILDKMWDEDAVPRFLKELGVEVLDPEMRALNCQLIALSKQHLASDYNPLRRVNAPEKQMVAVADKMLKKTSKFSDLPLNALTRKVAAVVVASQLQCYTWARFWLRRCNVPKA